MKAKKIIKNTLAIIGACTVISVAAITTIAIREYEEFDD